MLPDATFMGIGVRPIFEEHADFVWRVLARAGVRDVDLKDASQEVFIIVANKLDQLRDQPKVTTWLYAIAIRVAANQRRKVQRRREEFPDQKAFHDERDPADGPEQLSLHAEARSQLAELLDVLEPPQRIVFELFELEELTCLEIAVLLGIPLGTTYTRLRTARAALATRARGLSAEVVPDE